MKEIEKFKQFAPQNDFNADRKKAIIYTRVSTKEQADTNTSLSTQKRHCEHYAKSHGFEIVKYFGGTHESAKSDDRREFRAMLKYAKQSKSVGYIIVYSYDRFSRTGSSAAQITTELQNNGIQVKAVTQEVDTLSPSGKFQQNLFYMFSQFDNELRRDKTITAMTDLVKKGFWPFKPPRGYENLNKYQRAVDWVITITEEGKLLKRAFKWKVSGTYSNVEIVQKLNKLGMSIDERRIHEIFKNPFYCGILVCNMLPGEINEGRHPKIVSRKDFLKINEVESNHPKKHAHGNENLPLKQFAYCDNCNTPLTGFLVKRKGIYYYKCRTKGCSCTKSANKLHETFSQELSKLQINEQYHDLIKDVMEYMYESITHESRDKEAKVKKNITELNKKLDAIEERFAIGEINNEIYKKFSIKYKEKVSQLQKEIQNPGISSSNLKKAIDRAISMSTKLSETWGSADLENKLKIQQLVFPTGIGYNKQKDRVQTNRINSVFSAIPEISKGLGQIKKGEPIKNDQFSALVTPAGFKPATLRAEI